MLRGVSNFIDVDFVEISSQTDIGISHFGGLKSSFLDWSAGVGDQLTASRRNAIRRATLGIKSMSHMWL